MESRKEYEEKQRHGTVELPVGLHKMEYPEGTNVIFYLHWHQEFEFLVLTKGEIYFSIEENEYRLTKGDCVFINSNLLHSARTVEGKACSFFAVVFSYEALTSDFHSSLAKKYIRPVLNGKYIFEQYLSKECPVEKRKRMVPFGEGIKEIEEFGEEFEEKISLSWQQKVVFLLTQISQCPEHELEPYELLVRSKLLSVWNLMYQHGKENKYGYLEENSTSERLSPVVEYMKKNYAYEMSLTELAQKIPMSEGQFCRVFKQYMKMSPMQFLLRYRILQSCRLLQDTDKKIGEIANLTGFNNISYFNKVFLRIIGCTPKEYRNSSTY